MVPGDGGAKEGEVKVSLFRKKSCRVKGGSCLLSKCFSNLLVWLQVKPKFQTVTSFSATNHGRGSIGDTFTADVSLVPPV